MHDTNPHKVFIFDIGAVFTHDAPLLRSTVLSIPLTAHTDRP